MKDKKTAIIVGTICFILALAITMQLKVGRNANSAVSQTFANDQLRDSVLKWKERYDVTVAQLEQKEDELEKIRKSSTQNDSTAEEKQEKLKRNKMLLGTTNVNGSGITITLKDGVQLNGIGSDDISTLLVHDEDLRAVVNELKNAGAEAISINEQRIVISTSITCEGNVIRVNGEKIGSPFVIKAIGNQELLYGSLTRAGGYLQLLKDANIGVDTKKSNSINIEKYNGVINNKFMKNVE